MDRRKFLEALGAAAAAGVFLERGGGGAAKGDDSQTYYYLDSYNDVSPVDPAVIALGIYPPPLPPGYQTPTGPPDARPPGRLGRRGGGLAPAEADDGGDGCMGTATYPSDSTPPNILLIMVDQMRAPRWLPAFYDDPWDPAPNGWEGFTATYLPEINFLYNHSFVFPNYFPAATRCSPSRATLLTGLYSQQTCMFKTINVETDTAGNKIYPPSLIPYAQGGFPTIGDVLSQNLFGSSADPVPYTPVWIGKWHVSDPPGGGTTPGSNGPQDYGFDPKYSLPSPNHYGNYPNAPGYPSPDGDENEGNAGLFLDGNLLQSVQADYVFDSPPFPSPGAPAPLMNPALNDNAILQAFNLGSHRTAQAHPPRPGLPPSAL